MLFCTFVFDFGLSFCFFEDFRVNRSYLIRLNSLNIKDKLLARLLTLLWNSDQKWTATWILQTRNPKKLQYFHNYLQYYSIIEYMQQRKSFLKFLNKTAPQMKFSIKDFFSKYNQIRRKPTMGIARGFII